MRSFLLSHSTFFFIFLLFFAFILRFLAISTVPSGLHNDEASFLLNAVSLKETGRDEDNRSYPLYLNSFIDPKPALYSYLEIPFIYLMGPSLTAARLPGVFFGVLSIGIAFLLIKKLIDRKTAFIFSFLLTINPWHIMLSRGTQEVIMSFAFSLIAIFLLMKIREAERPPILITIGYVLSTVLAFYSYHAAKIFLPFIFLFILFYFGKRGRTLIVTSSIVLVVCLVAFISTSFSGGLIRANTVSIFSDPGTQLILNEEIRAATPIVPHSIVRIFHNKVVNYSLLLANNYSDYFTGGFLFFVGGQPARLTVPFTGLFYVIEAILFIFGIFFSFTKPQYKNISFFFLFWLLLAPLAGTLTIQEIPSITRTALFLIAFIYFITIGIMEMYERKNRIILGIIVIGYVMGICYFANQYIIQSQVYHPWLRNYADQSLVQKVSEIEKNYKNIYISTGRDSYVYFVLNNLIPLSVLQNSYPVRTKSMYTLSKYTFFKSNECDMPKDIHSLSVVGVACKILPESGFEKIDTANYKDGIAEYQLFIYKKPQDKL